MPLLGHAGHARLTQFITTPGPTLSTPDAILLVSAHRETAVPALTRAAQPNLVAEPALHIGLKNKHRFTDYILLWHKTPVSAVQTVIAIIAHDKIMPGRNQPLA